jgi:hypothetical protein
MLIKQYIIKAHTDKLIKAKEELQMLKDKLVFIDKNSRKYKTYLGTIYIFEERISNYNEAIQSKLNQAINRHRKMLPDLYNSNQIYSPMRVEIYYPQYKIYRTNKKPSCLYFSKEIFNESF